ncbi:hypothetical protein BXY75_3405 [Ulvibacter antarcticus]|uniref:DUF262 domain-containing protein n=2 Tax=Ulvibacter antarcticus TaxID=442714 RepID=A0A3L9Y7B2_9FLAO|nr:hypothetical protein BXY75_3405 [Ulvibacter antarcticus]
MAFGKKNEKTKNCWQHRIDIEKVLTSEVIVDGQQRLSTIIQYIDEEETSKDFGKDVEKYKNLTEDERNDFLNYNVVFRDLGDIESDLIKEVFRRINLTKFGLEQIEIHNAVYDGEFISTAKAILDNIEEEQFQIFSESELSRMSDLHYILLLMSTIINDGYFSRDTEIEKMVIDHNDEFEYKTEIFNNFIAQFQFIESLDLPNDSIWFRKSNFFTLFIEIYGKALPEPAVLRKNLLEFEDNILANKDKSKDTNDFSFYYSNMYTGTNNRTSRVYRGEIFNKYVI